MNLAANFAKNFIHPLMRSPGKLKESFENFSDDELRNGLTQLINGLERQDEILTAVASVSQNWRNGTLDELGWRCDSDAILHTTPPRDHLDFIAPWKGRQWKDANSKDVLLENMTRADLESGIRSAWEFTRHFEIMFGAGFDASNRILCGQHLLSEARKLIANEALSATRERPKVR